MVPSKKKKILVLTHMFPNRVHPYLGNQIYERTMELKKKYDVRVIAPIPFAPKLLSKINPYYEYTLIPRQEVINGVLVYHPRYFTFPGMFLYSMDALTYHVATARLISNIFRDWKFNLIDAHQTFPDGFVATRVAPKLLPRPKVVTTVHGADVHTPHSAFIRMLVISMGIKASDLVIAVSKIVKSELESTAPKANIITIPIGIKIPKRIPNPPSIIRKKIRNKFVILTVGNLYKDKGQVYVLEAVKKLTDKYKNIFCILVGSGPELGNLRRFVKKNELGKYVYFTGAVPNIEAHAYFKVSDVFVLPSSAEALGIVYMEAMMHGKPAIGCKGEGAGELITSGSDGYLIKSQNVGEIVLDLEKLIKNSELLKRMSDAAKKKALTTFQFIDRMKETERQLDNLINDAPKDYKDVYDESYYQRQGERFNLEEHGVFGTYFKKFHIKEPVLDLGCATGLFLQEAKNRGYKKIIGIDVSKYAVKIARQNGLRAYTYNGKKIPFKDNSFGTVFCYEVIEHVPRNKANMLLRECHRVLKSGGKLLLFSPADYGETFNTDPTHINFYPIGFFKNLITGIGFNIDSFESTSLLPSPLRNFGPFSYLVAKLFYRFFKYRGTTIELEASKI